MKRRATYFLLLAVESVSACRHVSVCENVAECSAPMLSAGAPGSASTPVPNPDGGRSPDDSEGQGGQAGEPTGSDAGSTSGGSTDEGPMCRPGTAECDGSSFTPCETPTTFSFRHCGACGNRCEGSCISGHCKPAEVILDRGVKAFVAEASRGFALVSSSDSTDAVYRFDLNSGASTVIADGLDADGTLVLGAGQVFVSYSDRVVGMAFDGTGLVTERFGQHSFGATKDGVYYTPSEYDPDAEPSQRGSVWFRATGESAFEPLLDGPECTILGSSRPSLLVERQGAEAAELLLVRGREVSSLGPSPVDTRSLLPLANGAAFLVGNAQEPSGYELLWLTVGEEPKHFAVTPELGSYLAPAPSGAALVLHERGNTFVRLFTEFDTESAPLGISNYSNLAYVDEHYFWYSWYASPDGLPRFLRARQFELSDAIPEE